MQPGWLRALGCPTYLLGKLAAVGGSINDVLDRVRRHVRHDVGQHFCKELVKLMALLHGVIRSDRMCWSPPNGAFGQISQQGTSASPTRYCLS